MPPDYDRPHIDISDRAEPGDYSSPRRNIGDGAAPRVREQHGQRLLERLRQAFQDVHALPLDEALPRAQGAYYEIELRRGSKPQALAKRRENIQPGAVTAQPDSDNIRTVVFVPDDAVAYLERILQEYATGPLTKKRQEPQRKKLIEPIEDIRRALLSSFWTDDPNALPSDEDGESWWEVWCHAGEEADVVRAFGRLECRVAHQEKWLRFPEIVVVPVLAARLAVERAILMSPGIAELKRGSDTPTFFTEDERENQHAWVLDLAERITWPGENAPRVCLLDTGVNRAHNLIEPALSEACLMTVNPDWPATDNQRDSHGTEMAGLALHGDLMPRLQDGVGYALTHRLESVRIIPADGFPPNEPAQLGSITLSAVSLAEIDAEHSRVFCMAITNKDRSGERGSSWSACIDRAAVGRSVGDGDAQQRRLFCVSAGNIPAAMDGAALGEAGDHPIEDPAQAWNVLTIGGYTDKTEIDPADPHFEGYRALAPAGDVSPFSRNSLSWASGKAPIKPEIVFEAGNRAVSLDGQDYLSCPSLELLTTGSEVDRLPLVTFAATSAATAQAARLAARLQADHPHYWPETIRALMVHSAEWTTAMCARLDGANGVRERQRYARVFGYGVPSYERATASARSDLALIAQREIQPYRLNDGSAKLNECHYYRLPWPQQVLEQYGEQEFTLKITLSYFVEPNPGKAAAIDPQRYQSFGLRFDLKRPGESVARFKRHINDAERAPGEGDLGDREQDPNWTFGSSSIAAGSLHCDSWRGTGAQLAARHMLCVKPVSGWWKERRKPEIAEQMARYALVVTLTAPDVDIDLYTSVTNVIAPVVEVAGN